MNGQYEVKVSNWVTEKTWSLENEYREKQRVFEESKQSEIEVKKRQLDEDMVEVVKKLKWETEEALWKEKVE